MNSLGRGFFSAEFFYTFAFLVLSLALLGLGLGALAFIRRHKNEFDILNSSNSNTLAALASGAFALAENYLFTTEAFSDYWQALSDSGYMILEHQAYAPRVRRNLLVLSKQPLTPEKIDYALIGANGLANSPYQLLHPAPDSLHDNVVNQIVKNGWRAAMDSAKVDLSPCTDNRPFIARMGLWRNWDANKVEKIIPFNDIFGFPLSKMIILIILAVVLAVIIPLNLLPYAFKGENLKGLPRLYFFSIGMAFMIVEIILIQKYSLFIGP